MALILNTDEYTNYIDSSKMIIEYYKNQTTTGLEKYFLEIEEWLNKPVQPQNNKPLIIEAEEGIGKKTLVVKWMEYHQANSKKYVKDLIIPNFAGTGGNNSNYFYAIYRIITKLRETFDIKQKVELLEQKLRKYFHYWLDVSSRIIHEQVVNDQFVILVFESINYYVEFDSEEEANVSMWLPKTFPKNVRVIIAVDPTSSAMSNLKEQGCDSIKIISEPLVIENQIAYHLKRPQFIDDESYKKRILELLESNPAKIQSLFVKIYLSTLLPYPTDRIIALEDLDLQEFRKIYAGFNFEQLKSIQNAASLNDFILDFFADKITKREIFRNVLCTLTLTQKGLTQSEIFLASKITHEDWNKLLAVFKTFLMKYQDYWKINNESFKKAIHTKYLCNLQFRSKLHLEIAEVLEKTPNSIRKLEEQTYHLFCGDSYFKLKEAVSNIENFLLLFNPHNKYELCRYWERLEQKGFDPTCEYNKAVESFIMHYKANSNDTFSIILQISRFIKEFSDFETELTPEFRHPLIKGGDELYDIGLIQEIVKLDMYHPEEWALSKVNTKDFKDVVSDEEVDENQAELDDESLKEKKNRRDESLKRILGKAKVRIEKNLALLNTNEGGPKHEVTHKKIMTLLGQPSALPPDQLFHAKSKINEDDTRKDSLRRIKVAKNQTVKAQSTTMSVLSPRIKPKYLEPQKKGAFDLYFETLNVEIEENKVLVRMMYMLMGGLIDESDINPNTAKKKPILAIEDETKPIEGEPTLENDESAKTLRGFDSQRSQLERLKEKFQKLLAHTSESRQILADKSKSGSSNDSVPSKVMKACFSSDTKYMSVKKEQEYTDEALKIAIEAKLKKKAVYAKADPSSELGGSNFLKSGLGESKILASIKAQKTQDVTRASQYLTRTHRKHESIDRPRASGKELILDNLTSSTIENKNFYSAKSQKNESNFFLTNDPNNLGYGNISTHRENVRESLARARQDSSTNSALFVEKSREYAKQARNTLIDSRIQGSLKDKVLLGKTPEKKPDARNLQMIYGKRAASNANVPFLDINASSVLPKLSSSLAFHSNKGLQNVQQKVDSLIEGYNDTAYRNKQLTVKLRELQLQKSNLTESNENPIQIAEKKISDLERKLKLAEKLLQGAKDEEMRLTTIINVCLRNKMENDSWVRELNYILHNIKKMLGWERQTIEKHTIETAEIKKYFMNLYQTVNEKINNHEQFIKHIKGELTAKEKNSNKLNLIDDEFENSGFYMNEKLKETYGNSLNARDEKKKLALLERNNKTTHENLDQCERDYEKIAPIVESAEEYWQTEQFKTFIDGLEKKNDLEQTIYEGKTRIAKIKEQIETKEAYIQTLKKASQMSKKVPVDIDVTNETLETKFKEQRANKQKHLEELQRVNQKNTQTILAARFTFKSICQKLGVFFIYDEKEIKSIPYSEIMAKYEDHLNFIKENTTAERYEQIANGDFDMEQFFKETSSPIDYVVLVSDDRIQ